jgi:hypothetical protein
MRLYCKERLNLERVIQYVNYEQFIQQDEFYISSTGSGEFTVWFLRWPEDLSDPTVPGNRSINRLHGNRLVLYCRANLGISQINEFVIYIMAHDTVQKKSIHITEDSVNGFVVWYWGRRDRSRLELKGESK